MRRTPARPGGQGKKPSGSSFKITYSVSQLLTMGKAEQAERAEKAKKSEKIENTENNETQEDDGGKGGGEEEKSDVLEGWQKFGYSNISPLLPEDGSHAPPAHKLKEAMQNLKLRPGSARDFHADYLAALAEAGPGNGDLAAQAQRGTRSTLALTGGARGGLDRCVGRGDRDRGVQGRYDRGDRDRHAENDRVGGGRGGAGAPSRGPSRWDALRPDRERDRGYNNRTNRERDVDGVGGGNGREGGAGGRHGGRNGRERGDRGGHEESGGG
ncbi:unnamed protein product, partial [Choristocarpus tenellus]